ncbi:hypothetical protein EVAR_7553_1 [Eumeta japonica]|uniref:Uncharacterized protein n=1 Tax=Eumeta variegata TaxID=151549 RepID=A0A4C1VRW5_EUMVA|nr:hypothetical protein EVAR_7553_1 [Eumeta japonica]
MSCIQNCVLERRSNQRSRTGAVVTVQPRIGVPSTCSANASVDSRQRPAAHASVWRSGTGRQLTRITTSPASASTITANTSGTSRRGRARRPRGPTQAVLRACVLPNTRAVRRASRRALDRPAYFCDYPQFIEIPDKHHRTKADVAAF